MTRQDEQLEQRLSAWLHAQAPSPTADLAERILRQTAAVQQRRRPAWFAMTMNAAAVAAIAVAAIVVGLQVGRLAERPIGGPSPSAAPATPAPSRPAASSAPAPSATPATSRARILFSGALDGPSADIYSVNADGSDLVRLTDDDATHETDAAWSPDGSRIVYSVVTEDGSMDGGTWVMNADGGEAHPISESFPYGAARWSPDGSTIATGGDGEEGSGIILHDPGGGQAVALTTDGGVGPRWSPDGVLIAYAVRGDVRVVDVGSGEVRPLTDGAGADTVLGWTPDGASVIFIRDGGETLTIPASGGEPTAFDYGAPFAFSPDGEWIAHVADGGLRLTALEGEVDRLVHARPADTPPSWTADGSAFVFPVQTDAGTRDVYLMEVGADEPVPVASRPQDEGTPAWR